MKIETAVFESSYGTGKQLPPSELPEIAFSGRSNVGKSSLLNRLLNRKQLARVSASPGKTVTVNFFRLDDCRFVDLPGYGYAKVSHSEKMRWAELMEYYFQSDRRIALTIQLIDIRHKPSADDYTMLDFLQQMKVPYIIVLTKADKLNQSQLKTRLEQFNEELNGYCAVRIPFSALKGTGREEILKTIQECLGGYHD